MARMRTVKGAVNFLRQMDPNTCVSEWFIRSLLKSGKLKHHKAGNRYLIDIDYLIEFLKDPPIEHQDQQESEYGILRRVR